MIIYMGRDEPLGAQCPPPQTEFSLGARKQEKINKIKQQQQKKVGGEEWGVVCTGRGE